MREFQIEWRKGSKSIFVLLNVEMSNQLPLLCSQKKIGHKYIENISAEQFYSVHNKYVVNNFL